MKAKIISFISLIMVYCVFVSVVSYAKVVCKEHLDTEKVYISNGAKGHKVIDRCKVCGEETVVIQNEEHVYEEESELDSTITTNFITTTSMRFNNASPVSTTVLPKETENPKLGKNKVCIYCERSNGSYNATPSVSIEKTKTIKAGEPGKTIYVGIGKSLITGWFSSDPSICWVDRYGTITGVKSGKVTIYAKASDGSVCFCEVTVLGRDGSQPTGDFKTLTEAQMDMIRKEEKHNLLALIDNIKIVVEGNTATLVNADGFSVAWTSSNNNLLTISSNGSNKATLNMDDTKEGGYVTITARITSSADLKKIKDGKSTYTCQVVVERGSGQYAVTDVDGHSTAINEVPWSDVAVIGVVGDGGFENAQGIIQNTKEMNNINFFIMDPHEKNYSHDSVISNAAVNYAVNNYKGKDIYLYSHSAGGYQMEGIYNELKEKGINVKGIIFVDVYPRDGAVDRLANTGVPIYIYATKENRSVSNNTRDNGPTAANNYDNVQYALLTDVGHGAAGGVGSVVTAAMEGKMTTSGTVTAVNTTGKTSSGGGSSSGGGGSSSGGSSSGGSSSGGSSRGGSSSGGSSSGGSSSGGSSTGTSSSSTTTTVNNEIVVEGLNVGTFYLINGEEKQLPIKVFYNSVQIPNPKLGFRDYDSNIFKIDSNGFIKTKDTGACDLTIVATEYYKDNETTPWAAIKIQVAVVNPEIRLIDSNSSVGIGRVFLDIGESINVGASLISTYASDLDLSKATFLWDSKDSKVATVDNFGKVTAVGEGKTTIVVTGIYKDGARVVNGECTVWVRKYMRELRLDPSEIIVEKKNVADVKLIYSPEEADSKKLLWLTSDPKIALVNRNGVVYGVDVGECTISVTDLDTNLTASAVVTVIKGKNSDGFYNMGNLNPVGKPRMDANSYSEEDWLRMEAELKERVEQAGWGTRAGVVEAGLYLCHLEYSVPYRGTPMDRAHYQGVYPKLGFNREWGQRVPLKKEVKVGNRVFKKGDRWMNGMDCTGYVGWCLVNGGLRKENDSTWTYFPREYIDLRNYASQVKPGDLAFQWDPKEKKYCHYGIVLGVREDTLYVGESNIIGWYSISANDNNWHIVPMDKEYAAANGEGNMPEVEWFN